MLRTTQVENIGWWLFINKYINASQYNNLVRLHFVGEQALLDYMYEEFNCFICEDVGLDFYDVLNS